MRSFNQVSSAPGRARKGGGEERGKLPEQAEEESQILHGTGHCKWFNVWMGFGFVSMINREGSPVDILVDVFVHQSKLFMEGFRSLKEGEPVEFTFKKIFQRPLINMGNRTWWEPLFRKWKKTQREDTTKKKTSGRPMLQRWWPWSAC